jgi:Secretion system C-terminal sorting domain
MRVTWSIFLLLTIATAAFCQLPDVLWESFYGDDRTDRGHDVGLQTDGTILVVGETRVFRDVQNNDDALVMWLSADGDSLNSVFSGTEDIDEFGKAIVVNPDDSFVIAGRAVEPGIGGYAFMAMYPANGGAPIWEVEEHFNMMPQNFLLGDVVITPDGGYVLCGSRTNGLGWGPEIMFLWKVDAAGQTVWLQEYDNNKYAYDIAVRADGSFFVAGANYNDAWIAIVDEDGVLLHHQPYSGYGSANFASGIIALEDGGAVFCGTILNMNDEHRARVVRIDAVGDIIWDARFGTEAFANDIIMAQDGNYVVVGSETFTFSQQYPMIAEMGADGNLLWYIADEQADVDDQYKSVCQREDGSYVAVGFGHPDGLLEEKDVLVTRYAAEVNAAPVELTLTSYNTEFPAGGGTLTYDLDAVSNTNLTFNDIRFWSSITTPGGMEFTPLDQYFITFTPFMTVSVDGLTQNIPSSAPAGEYTFTMRLGRPDELYVEDSFTFTKLGNGADDVGLDDWSSNGLQRLSGAWEDDASFESSTVPASYSLMQAYPNPFNAQTTISVTLPETSDLSVYVHNTLGQRVATLAQGQFNAGTHALTFDASDLSSGIYFYTMQAGEFTATRKMMLMK